MERLQKVLAAAGLGSRRGCEEIILAGRVEIDRQVVTELGVRVDPDHQEIRVDGAPIKIARREYYILNKPPGVISTNYDPGGRLRVVDLIDSSQRIFTIGRLDKASEGLIIVTNDGELAQKLTHPKFGCEKTYLIQVAGHPEIDALVQLKKGIHLSDGFAKIHDFRIKKKLKSSCLIEIVLKEGRNREIRRLLAKTGHKVLLLKRIAIGPIRLGELPLGAYRRLEAKEIKRLRELPSGSSPAAEQRLQQASRKSAAKPSRKPFPQTARAESSEKSVRGSNRKPSFTGKGSMGENAASREKTATKSRSRSLQRTKPGKTNSNGKGRSRKRPPGAR